MRHMRSPHVDGAGPHVSERNKANKASNMPKMLHAAVPGVLEVKKPIRR